MRLFVIALLFLSSPFARPLVALAGTDRLQIILPGGAAPKAFTVDELRSRIKPETLRYKDPVYGKEKRFEALPLGEVLKFAGVELGSIAADELVFEAKDGYAPTVEVEAARKSKAYLVIRDLDAKGGWEKIRQGKALISPAPLYLVWPEATEDTHLPWPYQLAKIELVVFAEKFARLFPNGVSVDSSEARGFKLFKDKCLKCHSINLQGGDLGPELNAPRNVLEYWQRNELRSFIKDSGSFRYRSKMPSFPDLGEKDIDDLLAYLGAMRASKVKQP